MNYQFSQLQLPAIQQVNITELTKLRNNNLKKESASLPIGVAAAHNLSWRSLDNIIKDIESRSTTNITTLEWIYCLYNKEKWDRENPTKSTKTSENIWQASKQNSWLQHKLLNHLALTLSKSGKRIIAQSLEDTFSNCISERLIVKVFQNIKIDNPRGIAEICQKKYLTPSELRAILRLSARISIFNQANNFIGASCPYTITDQYLEWLLRCFKQMSPQQQHKNVENILVNNSAEVLTKHPRLSDWLGKNYNPNITNSYYKELSSQAKAAIRKLVGAVNYKEFEKIVNTIIDLDAPEYKRLNSRKTFWSHFSDRFSKIRILLPRESVKVVGSEIDAKSYTILQEDNSEPTEICIFDFEDIFIVEFFRGKVGETRILKSNSNLEKILFDRVDLSVKKIRALRGKYLDHKLAWQYFCVEYLHSKNIRANQGITYFLGLPKHCSRYDSITGLPKPNFDILKQREKMLNTWRSNIEQLNDEAKAYCQNHAPELLKYSQNEP